MTGEYQSYLFNFSASYFGGGLKRILAYLQWFNARGGACFALHHRLKGVEKQFPNNRYCFLHQNSFNKVINYSRELNQFVCDIGFIDLYYSYGIPLPRKIGRINWMHVANVLTLINPGPYIGFKRAMELRLLGYLSKKGFKYSEVISAESSASLDLINLSDKLKIVSVNGSDQEINQHPHITSTSGIKNIAVAVGTCQYKCIDDVYKIYLKLRASNPELALIIVGLIKDVPAYIKCDKQVVLQGILSQLEVCELLKTARYYITATTIENSYNAASEGAFFAKEAFVSNIGPHRELLATVPYDVINHFGTRLESFHVVRENMQINRLKSWDQVVVDMINTVKNFVGP